MVTVTVYADPEPSTPTTDAPVKPPPSRGAKSVTSTPVTASVNATANRTWPAFVGFASSRVMDATRGVPLPTTVHAAEGTAASGLPAASTMPVPAARTDST